MNVAQKLIKNIVKFVNTYGGFGSNIITVKTPNTLYIFTKLDENPTHPIISFKS